jgi:hypothetical protein
MPADLQVTPRILMESQPKARRKGVLLNGIKPFASAKKIAAMTPISITMNSGRLPWSGF